MAERAPHTVTEISDARVEVSRDGQIVTLVVTATRGNHPLWLEMSAEVAGRLASRLSAQMTDRPTPSARQ
jgi:hypothetical protein